MDLRHLDSSRVKDIINRGPPDHNIKDATVGCPRENIQLLLNPPEDAERDVDSQNVPSNAERSFSRPGTRINTKDNPELLQYLPQIPKNATVYIDINIYVVEDDINTGQINGPEENVRCDQPVSDFNNSPMLSENIQLPEPIRIKKMVIPSISSELKKNTLTVNRPAWSNSNQSYSDCSSDRKVELEKRQSIEND